MLEGLPLLDGGSDGLDADIEGLREELVTAIGDGVMLYPSYTRVAPKHSAPFLTPLDWVYTAIFNVLELPVTQVPLGLSREGLPLGVQVVGPHMGDHRTIAVGMALERAMGGWVPPWQGRSPK